MTVEEIYYLVNYKECNFKYQPIIVKYYEYKYYNVMFVPRSGFACDRKTYIHKTLNSAKSNFRAEYKYLGTPDGKKCPPFKWSEDKKYERKASEMP